MEKTPDEIEQERISAAARAARTTIIAVAAVTLGSIGLMFFFTVIALILKGR